MAPAWLATAGLVLLMVAVVVNSLAVALGGGALMVTALVVNEVHASRMRRGRR